MKWAGAMTLHTHESITGATSNLLGIIKGVSDMDFSAVLLIYSFKLYIMVACSHSSSQFVMHT